jgi:hypothetical protein
MKIEAELSPGRALIKNRDEQSGNYREAAASAGWRRFFLSATECCIDYHSI